MPTMGFRLLERIYWDGWLRAVWECDEFLHVLLRVLLFPFKCVAALSLVALSLAVLVLLLPSVACGAVCRVLALVLESVKEEIELAEWYTKLLLAPLLALLALLWILTLLAAVPLGILYGNALEGIEVVAWFRHPPSQKG